MGREHIEFVQSQNVAWSGATSLGLNLNADIKLFGRDVDDGSSSALVRFAAGECAPALAGARFDLEIYLLDGELHWGDRVMRRHSYTWWPAELSRPPLASRAGALALMFLNARGAAPRAAAPPIVALDATAMPWDGSTLDPKLQHLRLSRKVLRLAADGRCRTYLLAGLPHGRPPGARLALERHPHDEEMFLIEGDMTCPEGVMRPGAYFYRPAGIAHGLHSSEHGFLMLLRSPGSNVIQTEWFGAPRELPLDPPFRPVLPPGSPAEWARPLPHRPEY